MENIKHLYNPTNTLEIIKKYGFGFQKRFGQNFLIDGNVVEKIVREAGITKDDFVLEIGPGIGTMTQILCENAREVAAVEIDKNLIPILAETLAPYDNVTVINEVAVVTPSPTMLLLTSKPMVASVRSLPFTRRAMTWNLCAQVADTTVLTTSLFISAMPTTLSMAFPSLLFLH